METAKQITIKSKNFNQFISKKDIKKKIAELADRINEDYAGKTVVLVVIMKGAMFFGVDLLRKLRIDCELEVITAKSYGEEMLSSGKPVLSFSNNNFKGKHILLVEDVIDTGITLKAIIERIMPLEPESLELAALLAKPRNMKVNLNAKYVGFNIPSEFIIGYGLDYANKGRNLRDLYLIDTSIDADHVEL